MDLKKWIILYQTVNLQQMETKYSRILVMLVCMGIMASFTGMDQNKKKLRTDPPEWEILQKHKTPEWFLDGKFGIYFH
jgi:hypothetical protein